MTPRMFVTHRQAGLGAFCYQCQPKDNKFRRLVHTLHCMVVTISNEHGKNEIFLCDDCIKGARAEAKKTGEFRFGISTEKVVDPNR